MKKLGTLVIGLLFCTNLYAADSVFIEYGSGNSAKMARIGAGWDWKQQWFTDGDWLLTGSWEASLGSWQGQQSWGWLNGQYRAPDNRTITDIGVTPVFRLQQKSLSGVAPYLEGAVGFHLISPTTIYFNKNFSSAFQFGDHVGAGMRFGQQYQYDLAFRYQHLSNGSIKKPNDGINFSQVHFSYHF